MKRLLIYIAFIIPSLVQAQEPYWEYAGLKGKWLQAIVAHPDGTIFVGSVDGGIYASRDHGKTWAFSGAPGATIISFTVNKQGHIFAGSEVAEVDRGGVWRSLDTGRTWQQITTGLTNGGSTCRGVYSIACKDNGVMFIGSEGYCSFYRSFDNGETWECASSDFGAMKPHVDIVIGKQGEIVGVGQNNVLRSWDNAETWEDLKVVNHHRLINLKSIFISPKGHIFTSSQFEGTFRSKDNGATWQGIYRSGIPWDSLENATSIIFAKDGGIYLSSHMGVFRSYNDGDSWQNAWSGLDQKKGIFEICQDSLGYMYVISLDSGVYRTRDRVVSVEDNGENLLKNEIKIAPNPTTENLTIRLPENFAFKTTKIILRDITGREIFLKEIDAFTYSYTFSVQEIPTGVYLLEVRSGNEVFIKQVSIIR